MASNLILAIGLGLAGSIAMAEAGTCSPSDMPYFHENTKQLVQEFYAGPSGSKTAITGTVTIKDGCTFATNISVSGDPRILSSAVWYGRPGSAPDKGAQVSSCKVVPGMSECKLDSRPPNDRNFREIDSLAIYNPSTRVVHASVQFDRSDRPASTKNTPTGTSITTTPYNTKSPSTAAPTQTATMGDDDNMVGNNPDEADLDPSTQEGEGQKCCENCTSGSHPDSDGPCTTQNNDNRTNNDHPTGAVGTPTSPRDGTKNGLPQPNTGGITSPPIIPPKQNEEFQGYRESILSGAQPSSSTVDAAKLAALTAVAIVVMVL